MSPEPSGKTGDGPSPVDLNALKIERLDGLISVEPKVMDVLRALIDGAGAVVLRETLIDSVWGVSHGGDERLSRAISILRRELNHGEGKNAFIETVPRRGYRLVATLAEVGEPETATNNATQARVRGEPPTLVVLPFLNLTASKPLDLFALELTEDLIDNLSDGVDLNVKARSAVMPYISDGEPDIDGMSSALGLRFLLQGNVRQRGGTVRVNTQLVDVTKGDLLWSQRFQQDEHELDQFHDQLVSEIAAKLRVQAHRHELARVLVKSDNLTSREAVFRGLGALRHMTAITLMQAMQEAQLAIELDENYGLAHALKAGIEGIIYNQNMPDNEAEASRIRDLANRAISLDPDDPALLPMAANALTTVGFPEEGLAAARRAVQLNEKSWQGYQACGMASTLLDECDQAIAYFDHQQGLAPDIALSWISYDWKACAFIRMGDWTRAEEATDIALRLTPDNAAPHIAKAIIRAQLGEMSAGESHMRRAKEVEPDIPLELWMLRFSRAYIGSKTGAQYLRHLETLWAAT